MLLDLSQISFEFELWLRIGVYLILWFVVVSLVADLFK